MKYIVCLLAPLVVTAAYAADKPTTTFGMKVPPYAVKPNIKHAEKRKQKALIWYKKHFVESKPVEAKK